MLLVAKTKTSLEWAISLFSSTHQNNTKCTIRFILINVAKVEMMIPYNDDSVACFTVVLILLSLQPNEWRIYHYFSTITIYWIHPRCIQENSLHTNANFCSQYRCVCLTCMDSAGMLFTQFIQILRKLGVWRLYVVHFCVYPFVSSEEKQKFLIFRCLCDQKSGHINTFMFFRFNSERKEHKFNEFNVEAKENQCNRTKSYPFINTLMMVNMSINVHFHLIHIYIHLKYILW